MQKPMLRQILERLVSRLDATIFFADDFGYAGFVEFANGRRTFFKSTSFDLNPHGASKIAIDKDYSSKILSHLGYPVPEGILLFSSTYREMLCRRAPELKEFLPGIETGIIFAEAAGFPLFVKPNEESEGLGVCRVYNAEQLRNELQSLFSWTERVLVQKPLIGDDFRLVILDGQLISAYRRRPLHIRGDGHHPISDLIDARLLELHKLGRGKKIDAADTRILRELAQQNRYLSDVPKQGEMVFLLANANLSTGGEAEELTEKVHPTFRSYTASIAQDMGLRLCGVDIITDDITAPLTCAPILEINAAPGLNNFAAIGESAMQIVEELYEKILISLRVSEPNQHPKTW